MQEISTARPSLQTPKLSLAKMAGLLYLVIISTGLWSELFARGPLVTADALETAANITAQMQVFRVSLMADVIMVLADIALALVFFAIFRTTAPMLATAAMLFRLVQAVTIAASLVLLATVPWLLEQGRAADALAMIKAHSLGYDIGLIYFGVNSMIMAVLLWRSAVPRLLALGIAAAGLVYIFGSASLLLAPHVNAAMQPAYLIPVLAETGFCLWLLLRGRI
ncbi:MAG: DUF4386 domain-containing protein [Rhodobacteraceae bacterium]|nr:DUF4386 domain-containing protein [Paracoccaceae bacterium]